MTGLQDRSTPDEPPTSSLRRTTTAGRRRSRPRSSLFNVAADWRDWVPPAVVRVLTGATCSALPAFEDRLGQVASPLVWAALAVFAVLSALVTARSEAMRAWPLNAVDGLTLAALVPTVVVASRIAVADSRLGGATTNFLAAAGAVLAVIVIAAVVSALTCAEVSDAAAIAFLPAALTVALIVAGAERFAADNVAQGLTAVWIVAGVATLAYGLANSDARRLVPPVSFALLAIIVAALARSGTADVARANAVIAFLVTVSTGIVLLLVPIGAEAARPFITEAVQSDERRD